MPWIYTIFKRDVRHERHPPAFAWLERTREGRRERENEREGGSKRVIWKKKEGEKGKGEKGRKIDEERGGGREREGVYSEY